jgi:hypothetical protein
MNRPVRARWQPLLTVSLLVSLGLALALPSPAWAAELKVSDVRLERCPASDVARQPESRRPSGASCYALRGTVINPSRRPIVDTDVYAVVVDASGEPVLPNRTRVGTLGDVPPGSSEFALRLAIPAGTPGPFEVLRVKARGFSGAVRARAGEEDELLPLERALTMDPNRIR